MGGAQCQDDISTSMNLDLTVNPDYSQVELDKQQTISGMNSFPRKRQFYLENSDLLQSRNRIGALFEGSGWIICNRRPG
jgi:hypothetical protein